MTRVSLSLSLSARSSPSVARYKGIKVSTDERRWGEEGCTRPGMRRVCL